MAQFLSWFWVGLAVILLLGVAIFVHEFGHFLLARWLGLRIEAFSIGFGPKIFGWRRHGVQYAWRWIPAGGYVKLPQMITSETLEGGHDATQALPPVSPWAKMLVAIAGPVMNVLLAFAIAAVICFVGLPVPVNPAIIGGLEPGSAAGGLDIRPGDRIVAVNGKPVTSWEDAQMCAAMAPTNVLPVTIERQGVRATCHVPTELNKELGLKLLPLEPTTHPVIEQVEPGSAAEAAGLKKGDEVLLFAGLPVLGQEQLVNLIRERPGKPNPIEIQRGPRRLRLTVTPRLDPASKAGRIGVAIIASKTTVYQLQRPGPLPWVTVGQVCRQIFDTLGALFHSRQTGVGVKDFSGPPGILAMLAAELKADYRLGLQFMVLLNVSLACFNLLPLPVLDGGHIAMAVVEKLRGRPLSPRIQEYATTAFALLLISFMLYVSYNDLAHRLPLFHSLFDQQVQIQDGPGGTNAAVEPKP